MLRNRIQAILDSPNTEAQRPVLNDHYETNVPGVYVVGELAGAPVVKLAMEQGHVVAHHIASKDDAHSENREVYDAIVIGAGAAGLSAALELQHLGHRVVVLEKSRIGATIADLPEGKWIYAEPAGRPLVGNLSLEEATKDGVIAQWTTDVVRHGLDVRTGEHVTAIAREAGAFRLQTGTSTYLAKRVILAIGKSGNPRKLNVPGEDQPHVHHKLYTPKAYRDKQILVVGGGNSAVEAAVALAEQNEVTLSYRGSELTRVSRANRQLLAQSNVRVLYDSRVIGLSSRVCSFANGEPVRFDEAFVLIGADPPKALLHALGVRLENEWAGNPWLAAGLTGAFFASLAAFGAAGLWAGLIAAALLLFAGVKGNRYALLGFTFILCYTIYGAKKAPGYEFWPYTGWGAQTLAFFGRPWSFWYTVLYTAAMTIFGIQAMKRWGFDRRDRFQIWRYTSLIGFQWVFFFLLPEVLFRWAVQYRWVGEKLASDPSFAENAWRSYGLIYAWPLFFYTFFGSPHQVWVVWGALLSFVLIPLLVLFHGKRYCSWICGCGGLAETLGDRWRHLAPKGAASIRWERMNSVVMAAAIVITIGVLAAQWNTGLTWYNLIVDTWLVGIVPVTLYPFFGGKIWCRYWCPLAKMMEIFSQVYTRFKASRFAIHSNEKCIACGDCSRNCQVGIDVMKFALRQEQITNSNSSCIGCGICVTVCPMDVLSFGPPKPAPTLIQIAPVTTAAARGS